MSQLIAEEQTKRQAVGEIAALTFEIKTLIGRAEALAKQHRLPFTLLSASPESARADGYWSSKDIDTRFGAQVWDASTCY